MFTIFLMLALFALSRLWVDIARASLAQQKTQTLSDMSTLSSLRITAEALATIAERWSEFGDVFGAASLDGSVSLPSSKWSDVEKKADDLKRALSGYQGRSTAVIKVVAEANGRPRESIDVLDNAGAQLNLVGERAVVRDENNHVRNLDNAWYSRRWTLDPLTGGRTDLAVHENRATLRTAQADTWTISRAGAGRLVWNVDRADPQVRATGNGGYPRTWTEAILNGRLTPYRWPHFRATLDPQ